MELMYLDESGDNGFSAGSSEYFILAGLSIESRNWKSCYWKIKELRYLLSQKYGLIANEIKGTDLFTHRGPFFNSLVHSLKDLSWIYERFVEIICDPMINLFAIAQSKTQFEKQFEINPNGVKKEKPTNMPKAFSIRIWTEYLTMYDAYLRKKSDKDNSPQTGLVYFDDNPSQRKYIKLVFKKFVRKYNQELPFPGAGIIEDIVFRDSHSSYFIQLADILAFSLNRIVSGRRGEGTLEISIKIRDLLMGKLKGDSPYRKWVPPL